MGTSHPLHLHQVCQLWAKPCASPGLLWKSGRHPARSSPCRPLPWGWEVAAHRKLGWGCARPGLGPPDCNEASGTWARAATPPSCPSSSPPVTPLSLSPHPPAFFLLPLPLLLPSLPPPASCRVAELWNLLLPLDAPAQVCDPPPPLCGPSRAETSGEDGAVQLPGKG